MKMKCLEEVVKITSSLIWDGTLPIKQLTSLESPYGNRILYTKRSQHANAMFLTACDLVAWCMFFLSKNPNRPVGSKHEALHTCWTAQYDASVLLQGSQGFLNWTNSRRQSQSSEWFVNPASSYLTHHPMTQWWPYVVLYPSGTIKTSRRR